MAVTETTPTQGPCLVVFDLDGTITRRDTLFGFVVGFGLRHRLRILGLVRVLPELLRFALGRSDHGRLKSALIKGVMAGCSRQVVSQWTREYIPVLLRRGVFFNAIREIEGHRAAGDHLVLMSATVDLYVPELAQALGFDEWICTEVRWQGDKLDGSLISANVRDEEKAHRLRELMLRFPGRQVVAYGNSLPDLPHLRLAHRRVLINASAKLQQAAAGLVVDYRHWR